MTGRWVARLPLYAVLAVCAAVLLFPVYMTFSYSLQTIVELLDYPPKLWPPDPQWGNYFSGDGAVSNTPIERYLFNSFVVAGVITVGQLVTSALAAYAFAFIRFPGRQALFVLFLATMMVPFEVAVIPNYQTIEAWGWLDTYRGLTVPFLATGFGTFLLRQHFLSLPGELRDAADIDGYGHWRFLLFVVVPLSRAALATLAVFAFLQAWNQYLWPLLVTNDPNMRTVQTGVAAEVLSVNEINLAFAGTILAFVPMLILVIAFQRYLVRGLLGGAVKG
jgi:ABC-type glycerol-3-phosphate transport system permease component